MYVSGMARGPYYSLVLSDLHFGDTRCNLHSMQTVRMLTTRLQQFQPLQEIILLGDILDLQLANWSQAVEGMFLKGPVKRAVGFRYFLNFLIEQTGATKICYIPGNHDYRIFEYHSIEKHLLQRLRTGKKLSGKVTFFRSFENSFLQGMVPDGKATIRVVYPHYSARINRSRVIFTHGHFFDPTQAFNHEIGKVFRDKPVLTPQEIRRIRHHYFRRLSFYQNMISGISVKRELRDWFSSLYQPFTAIKEKIAHRTPKSFLTPTVQRSIQHYVLFCCRSKKVDGLIFGHTHHPGSLELAEGQPRYVWNAGTFLRESKRSAAGSFLVIRNDGRSPLSDAVKLHIL